jgi:hypothetical protein
VFDESCEHAASVSADASSFRVVLVVDFANPFLASEEAYLDTLAPVVVRGAAAGSAANATDSDAHVWPLPLASRRDAIRRLRKAQSHLRRHYRAHAAPQVDPLNPLYSDSASEPTSVGSRSEL